MKRTTILWLLVAQLLFCCAEEQDNPLLVSSCTDKIRNQNEEGVDCGGVCGACIIEKPVVAPCKADLVNNRITLNGLNAQLTSADYICTQETDRFKIFIMKNNYEITIEIYGTALPKKGTEYDLDGWYDLGPGEASVQYVNFYSYVATNGKLYLSYANQKWTAEVCTVDLIGYNSSLEFSGRIIYSE